MLDLNPEYLSKDGRRQFVVLTVEEFERLKEAVEDAEDLRTLREATVKNATSPHYTPEQVSRRLRSSGRRPKKTS